MELEFVENAQATIDELMGDAARTLIEQLLMSSAEQVVGPKHRGRASGVIGWHGTERGRVEFHAACKLDPKEGMAKLHQPVK